MYRRLLDELTADSLLSNLQIIQHHPCTSVIHTCHLDWPGADWHGAADRPSPGNIAVGIGGFRGKSRVSTRHSAIGNRNGAG